MTDHPWKGRGQGHPTHLRLLHPWNISRAAKAGDFNFCNTRVDMCSISLLMTNCPPKWAWSGSCDPFFKILQALVISLERMNLDTSRLVCRLIVMIITIHTLKFYLYPGSVDGIALILQQNRLRWYGHVLRKDDDDWVKKCMEYEVEGSRPRGRLKRTWKEVVRE